MQTAAQTLYKTNEEVYTIIILPVKIIKLTNIFTHQVQTMWRSHLTPPHPQ